ncbi:hypothetical protein HYX11_01800 [Candidatus Woesearchaeota archaeon]|nr:hypothetical protein [Candidatus Woesearchaeota archaeon]
MELEQKFENIPGNLQDAYKQCLKGTMLHAYEIMRDQREDVNLYDISFHTAEGIVYSLDHEIPRLRITPEKNNPVLDHIDDEVNNSYKQLANNGIYKVLPADFNRVKSAEDTVTIDLTQLRLQRDDNKGNWCLVISITNYDKLNQEECRLAECIYGQGTADFRDNMGMLKKIGVDETKVYVLHPEYVKTNAKENALGRVAVLESYFYHYWCFSAIDRGSDHSHSLRGVRK